MKVVGHPGQAWPYPRWVARRGAGKLAPENTLAAFHLGAALGYRMFECDVKLSADGVPFLLHDDTLTRTTNATWELGAGLSTTAGDHPWSTLSLLDAGSWHSRAYAGEPIPAFEAVARLPQNAFDLNIEIKPTTGTDQHTGQVVAQARGTPVARRGGPAFVDLVFGRCARRRVAVAARVAAWVVA